MDIKEMKYDPKKTILIINLLMASITFLLLSIIIAGVFLKWHELKIDMVIFLSIFSFLYASMFLLSHKTIKDNSSWGAKITIIVWLPQLFFPPIGTIISIIIFYSVYKLKLYNKAIKNDN